MAKTHLVRDSTQPAGSQQSFATGSAVADANVGSLTLLSDAITAIGTLQTKLNATLAALRDQGIIAP